MEDGSVIYDGLRGDRCKAGENQLKINAARDGGLHTKEYFLKVLIEALTDLKRPLGASIGILFFVKHGVAFFEPNNPEIANSLLGGEHISEENQSYIPWFVLSNDSIKESRSREEVQCEEEIRRAFFFRNDNATEQKEVRLHHHQREERQQLNEKPLTMEEQVALFEGINNLLDCQLSGAVQILCDASVVNEDDNEINLELAMLDIATQRKLQCYVATAFDDDDEMKKNRMKSMNESIPRKPKTAAQKHEEAMNLKEWRDSQQRNREALGIETKGSTMPDPANDVVLRILAEKDHRDANPSNHSGEPRSISSLAKAPSSDSR
jgi:hypothetical protein